MSGGTGIMGGGWTIVYRAMSRHNDWNVRTVELTVNDYFFILPGALLGQPGYIERNIAKVVQDDYNFPIVAQFLPMARLVLIQSHSRKRVTVFPLFVTGGSTPIDSQDTAKTKEGGCVYGHDEARIQTGSHNYPHLRAETRPIHTTEILRAREGGTATKVAEDHDDSVPKAVSGTFVTQYLAVLSLPVSDGGSQAPQSHPPLAHFCRRQDSDRQPGLLLYDDQRWSHRRRRQGCTNAYQAM
ncbi:hypothetical protein ARMGADRAFT_1022870 [Armillaria gallica]|uniref:Uncharacterized protein n=1 Tax=Armillaria gallica TaxID=47427 RepID=A0A2H3EEM1_ARMGA|nr:hypothetical protein ARMGADRAFT_1022870 [Armillaria gallica]